jgi:tripartite-type tricarboxylate transporter receptor subunit TctC
MAAGQIASLLLPDGAFLAFSQDNRARVLATSGTSPSQFYPKVPTFAEQGVKDIVVTEWFGMFMPPATPAAVVERAAQAIGKVLVAKDVTEIFAKSGMVPTPTTPAELARMIKAETEYWGPVIKSTGFKPIE